MAAVAIPLLLKRFIELTRLTTMLLSIQVKTLLCPKGSGTEMAKRSVNAMEIILLVQRHVHVCDYIPPISACGHFPQRF